MDKRIKSQRVLTRDETNALLKLAGINSSKEVAISRLQFHFDEACCLADPKAVFRPTPDSYNSRLTGVRDAAKKLIDALDALNSGAHTHANAVLWLLFLRGLDENIRDADRAGFMSVLHRLLIAADEATVKSAGGRPKEVKRKIVEVAYDFFARNSPHKPSQSATGPFSKFACKFFEVVTGDALESLASIIRNVVKERANRG